MAEVFAWPEGRLWIYSANAVSPTVIAYAERVSLSVEMEWRRYRNLSTGAWDQRITEVHSDKRVMVNIGLMWSDNTWLLRTNSASAWNVSFSAENPVSTAAWMVWSAVIVKAQQIGQMGGLGRFTMALRAPDFSAV